MKTNTKKSVILLATIISVSFQKVKTQLPSKSLCSLQNMPKDVKREIILKTLEFSDIEMYNTIISLKFVNKTFNRLIHAYQTNNEKKDIKEALKEMQQKIKQYFEPLHGACRVGAPEVVKNLIRIGYDKNSKDIDKDTPLHIAVKNGHIAVVKVLLDNNTQIETLDQQKNTPLHLAVKNGHQKIVRLLLQYKPNLEAKNKHQHTPLYSAAQKGHEQIIQLLLKHKAHRQAPLFLACQKGDLGVIQQLVPNKKDLEIKNESEYTLLHLAVAKGHIHITKFLLEMNANPALKGPYDRTALHLACTQNNRTEIVQLLLNKNPELIEAKDKFQQTPLHLAAVNGKSLIVKMLLKNKANIHQKNSDGRTALHLAAKNGHNETISILLLNKANIIVFDNKKKTPIDLARWGIGFSTETLLLDHLKLLRRPSDASNCIFRKNEFWPNVINVIKLLEALNDFKKHA